ncbi:Uncharacterised protein [Grimontia hollisae]|nr:Uncharacterised protein [Grimontia hollisae]
MYSLHSIEAIIVKCARHICPSLYTVYAYSVLGWEMSINHSEAIAWLISRAAENTANQEDNTVLPYLLELVEADIKTGQVVAEASDE